MPNAGPSGSQAISVSNPRVQWIRSTLALCVSLGFLYIPMLMTSPLLHLALTTILFFMAGHVIWAAWHNRTTIIGVSVWMQFPVARSIPVFPAIAADQTNSCLLNTPPLSDKVLKQIDLYRFIIFASMVILVHRNLDQVPRFHSDKSITACPAIVSANVQKALQACAALNVFGKYPGKRMGMRILAATS
jgi:hypothetical protein